ncbi:MAG TPA: hypothetical protein VKE95_07635 [Burkholderiales bacterium]|nr:hypothetical protein [Burkholderiales bacterium]
MRSARMLLVGFGLFGIFFPLLAPAGTAYPVPVTVNPYDGVAYGSVVDARSPNTYLQCMMWESGAITCDARDHYGAAGHCTLDPDANPAFAKNVLAINNASFVEFHWNPATGVCTDMRLINGSQFLQAPPAGDRPDHFPVDMYDNEDGTFAFGGGVSSARYYDDNPWEFISCDVWASGYIYCVARHHSGSSDWCYTYEAWNPSFAERARSIDSTSLVRVAFVPSNRVCTRISVSKGSRYLP